MTDNIRDGRGYIELCCRECGEWKDTGQMDSSSVFRRPEGAAEDQLAVTWDFETPLCLACRDRGDAAMENTK